LISHSATSAASIRRRASSFRIALIGASVNRCGSTAVTALPTISPSGSSPSSAATSSVPISAAVAPSLIGDELPAVTGPFSENAERSFRSFSRLVSGRTDSSRRIVIPSGSSTGNTKPSCTPASHAAAARRCERRAKASICARLTPTSAATTSAAWPSGTVHFVGILGLTSRQPSAVDVVSSRSANGFSGLGTTNGARVMPSTPPAISTSASPSDRARAAWTTASPPDAHSRLIVTPGTLVGSPASSAAIRATSRFSSPAPFVLP
jgi:hypothetical protein